jgi:hypothetical protein
MRREVVVRAEAERDIRDTRRWYATISPALGEQFLDVVDQAIASSPITAFVILSAAEREGSGRWQLPPPRSLAVFAAQDDVNQNSSQTCDPVVRRTSSATTRRASRFAIAVPGSVVFRVRVVDVHRRPAPRPGAVLIHTV